MSELSTCPRSRTQPVQLRGVTVTRLGHINLSVPQFPPAAARRCQHLRQTEVVSGKVHIYEALGSRFLLLLISVRWVLYCKFRAKPQLAPVW